MGQGGAQRRRGHADENMKHVLQVLLLADGQPGGVDVVRQGSKQRVGACRAQQRSLLDTGIAVQDSLKLLSGQILSPLHQSLE